jgi:hypothetical protein
MPDALEDRPTLEERRALIQRVAASEQFSRSARLRDFLLYVGKQSLKDGSPEIHEQEIGAKVFGRSAAYDRSQDNIVRVNATELRKRIELYFASDGARESLILEIPRGGYMPVFHRRLPESEKQPEPMQEALQAPPAQPPNLPAGSTKQAAHGSNVRLHLIWGILSLLLAIASLTLLQHDRAMRNAASAWNGKPAVAAFWEGFLQYNQQTDIVLPDDSVSVIQDITHRPISLGEYLSRDYMRQIQSSSMSADRKADLDQILNHNLVTFGGVRAAQQILSEISAPHTSYLTLARHYNAEQCRFYRRQEGEPVGSPVRRPGEFRYGLRRRAFATVRQ